MVVGREDLAYGRDMGSYDGGRGRVGTSGVVHSRLLS